METLKIKTTHWVDKINRPMIRVSSRGGIESGINLPPFSNNVNVGNKLYEDLEELEVHEIAIIQRMHHTARFFTKGLPEHAKIILVKDRGHIKDWEIKL